ncbi:MAG: PTS sugar transporter subunit IIA [Gammaproteobacteria bacterium]|nr:PTS sugar transporter subunit IIA [Gammaproteobacteria bacterium]MCI0590507.1 PTS sugar transporter subunit IIA [Gammaproteobacteria bacterium]
MSIGLLIISHDGIGSTLLETASHMLGQCPLKAELLPASRDADPDAFLKKGMELVASLDEGDGVLILTDLYGSTPSNIAKRLLVNDNVRIVTGVSLPMLVRVLNYPHLKLDQLVQKAISGGRDGVFLVVKEDER